MSKSEQNTSRPVGEFEQMVLLCILRLGDRAYAIDIRRELQQACGRRVTRGALYRTLDRMEAKGYLCWTAEAADETRDSYPRRSFQVSPAGIEALRTSRETLLRLWSGLDGVLEER